MCADRFSLSVEEYLTKKHVLFYIEDCVTQVLEHKEEYTQFGILRFLSEYFNSVKKGNHILFREFSFVRATPHNRSSFLHMFWRCFRQIGKNGDLLSMMEYASLLQLICPDFPEDVVQKAARIVLMDDAMDCPMSFSDFLYAFQIQFYYEEFLESTAVIYQDLLSGKCPNTVIVPTSSSVEQRPRLVSSDAVAHEGVDSFVFCNCVEGLCERFKYSFPPVHCVKEILGNVQRISFYSFLMALAKHEEMNSNIGSLPSKAEVLIDPEMDKELEKLIAQISLSQASNSSNSTTTGHKEPIRKASPKKALHHRRRIEVESDGSTEETDSSEN